MMKNKLWINRHIVFKAIKMLSMHLKWVHWNVSFVVHYQNFAAAGGNNLFVNFCYSFANAAFLIFYHFWCFMFDFIVLPELIFDLFDRF